jgi:hypothetical protein
VHTYNGVVDDVNNKVLSDAVDESDSKNGDEYLVEVVPEIINLSVLICISPLCLYELMLYIEGIAEG